MDERCEKLLLFSFTSLRSFVGAQKKELDTMSYFGKGCLAKYMSQ